MKSTVIMIKITPQFRGVTEKKSLTSFKRVMTDFCCFNLIYKNFVNKRIFYFLALNVLRYLLTHYTTLSTFFYE